MLLVLDAAIQQALLCSKLFVVLPQHQQRRVIKIFHYQKNYNDKPFAHQCHH